MNKKKIIIISVSITLALVIFSILINTFVFYLPNQKNKEEREKLFKQFYQAKIETFAEENKTISNPDVVFLGDSLTDGYDLTHYYPEYNCINRGISGDTTFGLEKRLRVSAFEINPKVVCMLIGGNNLSTMFQNYEQILISLKENLPNTKIILLSLTAMGNQWAKNNDLAIANNQKIKSMAQSYQFEFVDLFTPLYDYKKGTIKDGLSVDGVHFSSEGYTIVTEQIKPILANLLI